MKKRINSFLELDNNKEGKFKTLRKEDLQNIISKKKEKKNWVKIFYGIDKNMKETKSLILKVNNNKKIKKFIYKWMWRKMIKNKWKNKF